MLCCSAFFNWTPSGVRACAASEPIVVHSLISTSWGAAGCFIELASPSPGSGVRSFTLTEAVHLWDVVCIGRAWPAVHMSAHQCVASCWVCAITMESKHNHLLSQLVHCNEEQTCLPQSIRMDATKEVVCLECLCSVCSEHRKDTGCWLAGVGTCSRSISHHEQMRHRAFISVIS